MSKNEMDRTGKIIIGFCIFSIILSLTAVFLGFVFNYFTEGKTTDLTQNEVPTIIIDAGHGGNDGGASATDGTKEKDLNLEVTLKLGSLLKSSGFNVIFTRDEDVMLSDNSAVGSKKMKDLKKRLQIANDQDNAVFISIHMNKFSQEKYSGLQVFYSPNRKEGEILARIVQAKTKQYIQGENSREIKSGGNNIYLLQNLEIPGILVECGFLSNPQELAVLKDSNYQKELAAVIYSSIIEFFEKT